MTMARGLPRARLGPSALTLAACALAGCDGGSPTDDAATASLDAARIEADAPGLDAPGLDAHGSDDAALAPDAATSGEIVELGEAVTESSGSAGELDVAVTITDQRSFMVVATSENASRLSVLSITDPSGATVLRWQDWWDAPHFLTGAIFTERTGTTINWPIRAEDPPLEPGTYLVRIGSYRVDGVTSRPDIDVTHTTITNRDHDLADGVVHVAIVWAQGMSDDAALVDATARAVDHWNEVWGGVGMHVEVRYVESTIDPALPEPSAMSGDVLLAASSLVMPGEVAMIVGETIAGGTSLYGVAGHIPGPIVPSPLGAIVVGWLSNAGGDGVFSDADLTLYGEVLAHEVGHFVGLTHPVERSYEMWDALTDTPECSDAASCEASLGTNLMFPYSICDADSCVSTTILTDQQRGVMQRYTGTR
ncbi:MAG: hypothetical protein U0353_34055 [Sandaracinus sp.]